MKLWTLCTGYQHILFLYIGKFMLLLTFNIFYRLISELPEENIVSTACQWSKLVYTSLISTAHRVSFNIMNVFE